jgi:hypothetical protein
MKTTGSPRATTADARQSLLDAFAQAQDKGCDDPFVLSLYHLAVGKDFGFVNGHPEGRVSQQFSVTLDRVHRGAYAPGVKVWLTMRYIRATRQVTLEQTRDVNKALAQLAKTPDLPAAQLDSAVSQLYDAISLIGPLDLISKKMLADAYTAIAPQSPQAMLMNARVILDEAWRIHTDYPGKEVDQINRDGFNQRCAQAAQILESAWKLDPNDARIASLMITCSLRDGDGGGREAIEQWYARAMNTDPDCRDACGRKLYALYPGWYGSPEEIIAFGRECLATENWRGGIPAMILRAHQIVADRSGDSKEYYARPDVWRDLADFYEGQLLNYPDDARRRSELAKAAIQAGRWDVANREFNRLGDNVVPEVFDGKATLDYLKRKAARLGSAPPSDSEQR